MKDKKPNKEVIVYEIIGLIESGKSYNDSLSVICSKFQFTSRTFNSYWKKAQVGFQLLIEERKRIRESVIREEEREATKRQIMDREKKLEILETVIMGEPSYITFFVKGQPKHTKGYPTTMDRLRAIEIHNRITGDNAPDKHIVDTNKGAISLNDLTEEEKDFLLQIGERL